MNNKIIPPHGGYRSLESYKNTVIIHDFTVVFCEKYISRFSRTRDQMVQAARSGKQNIVEGSQASGTSKKTEIKLLGVARASLAELLEDYEDFIRQKGLKRWDMHCARSRELRALAYRSYRTYETYKTYMSEPEPAANTMICLVNQTNYLLDHQIQSLEENFQKNGGFTENLYKSRRKFRKY